jgi:hypothetical protein
VDAIWTHQTVRKFAKQEGCIRVVKGFKVSDIGFRAGTGRKDRYVMLSDRLL